MKKLILLATIALSFMMQAGNLEIGEEYRQNKDYEQAEKYFLKALEEGNKAAYNNLGILYKEQKKYDKAEQMYKKAIENKSLSAIFNLGILYHMQKKI